MVARQQELMTKQKSSIDQTISSGLHLVKSVHTVSNAAFMTCSVVFSHVAPPSPTNVHSKGSCWWGRHKHTEPQAPPTLTRFSSHLFFYVSSSVHTTPDTCLAAWLGQNRGQRSDHQIVCDYTQSQHNHTDKYEESRAQTETDKHLINEVKLGNNWTPSQLNGSGATFLVGVSAGWTICGIVPLPSPVFPVCLYCCFQIKAENVRIISANLLLTHPPQPPPDVDFVAL